MALWVKQNPTVPPCGIVEAVGWQKIKVAVGKGVNAMTVNRGLDHAGRAVDLGKGRDEEWETGDVELKIRTGERKISEGRGQ